MCKGISTFCLIAFILAIVAFVLDLIGFAAPYWLYVDRSVGIYTVTTAYGLWQGCTTIGSSRTCTDYTTKTSAFEAAEAFEILGFLVLLAIIVCFLLYIFVLKDKGILCTITMILCFVGFLFILLGVITFGANTDDFGLTSSNLHFAFAFCLIAAIIILVAGVLLLVETLTGKKTSSVAVKA